MKFEDWIRHKLPKEIQFEKEWRSNYYEWAEYVIDTDILFSPGETEIDKWIKKNLIARCIVYHLGLHSEIFFELEEDAVLFALRWG